MTTIIAYKVVQWLQLRKDYKKEQIHNIYFA